MSWVSDLLGIHAVYVDNVLVSPERKAIDFREGGGITIDGVDDPATGRTRVTISSSAFTQFANAFILKWDSSPTGTPVHAMTVDSAEQLIIGGTGVNAAQNVLFNAKVSYTWSVADATFMSASNGGAGLFGILLGLNGVGVGSTNGLSIGNTSAATSGLYQFSPLVQWEGRLWTGSASGVNLWTAQAQNHDNLLGVAYRSQALQFTSNYAGSSAKRMRLIFAPDQGLGQDFTGLFFEGTAGAFVGLDKRATAGTGFTMQIRGCDATTGAGGPLQFFGGAAGGGSAAAGGNIELTPGAGVAGGAAGLVTVSTSLTIGATPATLGSLRLALNHLTRAGTSNYRAWSVDGSGNLFLGTDDTGTGTNSPQAIIGGGTGVQVRIAGAIEATFNANVLDFNTSQNANYSVQGNGEAMLGFNIAASGVRNLAMFNDGSAGMQSMDGGVFFANSIAAPTGNPTAGVYKYATSGAGIGRGTGGTVTTYIPA